MYNRNAKLAVGQFAGEPVLVVHSIVHGLNLVNQCPRHSFHQFNCTDPLCEQCRGEAVDLDDVDCVYGPVILGRTVLMNLPLNADREEEIRQDGRGVIYPNDVDWDTLDKNPSELFLNFQIMIEKKFYRF